MLLSSLSFFQIIVRISLLDLLIAAAIADRIATAGALIFRVQSFLQLRDRHLLCNGPSGPVPFTDSRLMWFSSAIRASGDTFIFRISAVL
jgi:hypothetical protein